MFGVLFDVSGSMRRAFAAHYNKRDALTDSKIKRSHGIITTLNNIVSQEITVYERKDMVFTSAFGLNTDKCEGLDTCDFVTLLENRKTLEELDKKLTVWEEKYSRNGHRILIQFAEKKKAPHTIPWIKEKLSQRDAGILWEVLKDDNKLTKKLIDLIPSKGTRNVARTASGIGHVTSRYVAPGVLVGGIVLAPFTGFISLGTALGVAASGGVAYGVETAVKNAEDDHEALKLARDTVTKKIAKEKKILQKLQKLQPRFIKDVSDLLDTLLKENKEASSSRVQEIIDSIEPYIYGKTPMVKALRDARKIFDNIKSEISQKVLFILSDGLYTDEGDPTYIAQQLQHSNVIVATCYFTSESIPNSKCLFDKEDTSWNEGVRTLFHMSSTMPNTSAPITHLVDYGWKLPESGECRLFVQANSLDVVEEFCKVAVSQLTHSTDALVHMLGRVSLNTYINQKNDDFEAPQQIGATCYANAIAAVFHLAMYRFFEQEEDIPKFLTIRGRIIREYGKEGADTDSA